MALNAVADTKPSSVTGSSYRLPVRLSVTVREPTPPPGASRIFWSAPARWVKTGGGARGESRWWWGHFGGLRPAGKKRPFARAGSGRGTRGVLTGGGRVPLDHVALIVRRAQVAGQMANPFARPRLVRHGVKCGRSAGALGCQILGIASFAMRVLFTSNRRGRCGPSLGARGNTGRARRSSARRRRMETRVGGSWSRRAVCLCPASSGAGSPDRGAC
jgi:hypothetical protein